MTNATDSSAPVNRKEWLARPSAVQTAAVALVVLGLALTGLNWWFLILAALGTAGPGVLRELGWLHDQDELQRRAAQRAGYHAFLASTVAGFLLLALARSTDRLDGSATDLPTLFLGMLLLTWLLSSLIGYWGAPTAVRRLLLVFGSFWLAFTVLSSLGPEWQGVVGLIMKTLLAAPFFVLAWLAERRPRLAGCLLLTVAGLLGYILGFFTTDNLGFATQAATFVLFIGPLLGGGLALVGSGAGRAKEPERAESAR